MEYNINKIKKGDRVFLYRSGTGVVAMGIGNGEIKKKNYHDKITDINEECYTYLDNYVKLSKPLKASEIKKITNTNYVFRATMFGIGEENGRKLWDYIINNCCNQS